MKYSIDTINEQLSESGWKCISEEYTNLDSELTFTCQEGHNVYSTWKKIRQKQECPICRQNIYKRSTKVVPKKKGQHRVLALDQATYISGWSIYDNRKLTQYGVFETDEEDEIVRDNAVKEWLISMIETWGPDLVAIEGIQYQKEMGVTTFQTLARLQGILMMCCHELGLPFKICPTNTWRKHCKVKGQTRSDKKTSARLLAKQWFDITVTEDEADAIGIGKYASETFSPVIRIEKW